MDKYKAAEAFADRYQSDPSDPAVAADLAIYRAGWNDAQAHPAESAQATVKDSLTARAEAGAVPAGWRELLRQSEDNFLRQYGVSVAAAWVYRDLEELLAASPASPAQAAGMVDLTDSEIEAVRKATFSTENPYCPVDRKSMWKAALAITVAFRRKNGLTPRGKGGGERVMEALQLKVDGRYNWRYSADPPLSYMGARRYPGDPRRWHQFERVAQPGIVWCEVLDSDLHLFEETAQPPEQPHDA